MKWMFLGTAFTLAACSAEPAENLTANGPAEGEPATAAAPGANVSEPAQPASSMPPERESTETGDIAATPPSDTSTRPYQPLPESGPPGRKPAAPRPAPQIPDPHAGHDMDNMTHDPQH
ncbi:MAG: hypothetical protein ACXWUN_10570 [Allosphingosinicella sp.]